MNPGVIDVQNSHKRACQPGDGWIFAGGGGRGVARYGVAAWNWVIRALTVQTGAPRSTNPATNGLPETETCLMVDVIRQHARRHKRRPVSLFAHNPGAMCSLLTSLYLFLFFLQGSACARQASVWQVCQVCCAPIEPAQPPGRNTGPAL